MIYFAIAALVLLILFAGLAWYSRCIPPLHSANVLPDYAGPGALVHSRSSNLAYYIAPLEYMELERVVQCAEAIGWKVLRKEETFVHFECRSTVFGFTDDVFLEFDKLSGQIYVCSRSRVGMYDFNANRRRVEYLRQQLLAFKAMETTPDGVEAGAQSPIQN